jgi:hypothetical protein
MTQKRQTFSIRTRFGKWAGSWLGASAWFADQQIVAATAYAKCPASSYEFVTTVGVVCAAVAILGAWLSWRARQMLPAGETASASFRTDRFIATLSLLLAVIALLAIIFGTAAGLILRCER